MTKHVDDHLRFDGKDHLEIAVVAIVEWEEVQHLNSIVVLDWKHWNCSSNVVD